MSKEADQPKGPDSQEQELRKIGKTELQEILAQHKSWVESEGKEGTRARLRGANLQEADLRGAKLQKADLRGANLRAANLQEANLQEADLREANLQKVDLSEANLQEAVLYKADLRKADLSEANLQEADMVRADLQEADLGKANLQKAHLSGAKLQKASLAGAQLRGAILREVSLGETDLHDADLHETLLRDTNLDGSRGLQIGQLSGADVNNAKLPAAFLQFQGPLSHIQEASKNARRFFAIVLLACSYAFLTILSTTDAALLTNAPSFLLPNVATAIPTAGFYIVGPLVILGLYIWFHFYMQHLWMDLSELPAVLPDGRPLDRTVYPWLPNGLVRAHFGLLRKEKRSLLTRMQLWSLIFLLWWVVPFAVLLFWGRYLPRRDVWIDFLAGLLAIATGLAVWLQRDTRRRLRREPSKPSRRPWREATRASLFSHVIGSMFPITVIITVAVGFYLITPAAIKLRPANLREADISIKPTNWTGKHTEGEITLVKGAQLRGKNLRNAEASGAFLVKADLSNANLQKADLRGANLQKADLRGANLLAANLQGAELYRANLQRAMGLTASQVKAANHWKLAFYSDDFLTELGLPADHNKMLCSRAQEAPEWCRDFVDHP